MNPPKPPIAIISQNALCQIGIKSILEKIIPFADIHQFDNMTECASTYFMHYFITQETYESNKEFFHSHPKQTIIFTENPNPQLPFHQIKTSALPQQIVKDLLIMLQEWHRHFHHFPDSIVTDETHRAQQLTSREIEILKGVAIGLSSKEIAEKLYISPSTVTTHRRNIMDKLNAHSATKLVTFAVLNGYIKAEEVENVHFEKYSKQKRHLPEHI